MMLQTLPSFLLALFLVACSKPTPAPDAAGDLARIVAHPKNSEVVAKVVSCRTEPTATPSHSAVIEVVDKGDVYRLALFRKDGVWHYDRPISLVSQGTPITGDITTDTSTVAYKLDLRR